jgi:hypothetical protein
MRLATGLAAVSFALHTAGAQTEPQTVHASLFGDFNYVDSKRVMPEGFRLGQLAGHITWSVSDRLTFFSEATATGQATGYALEVERLLLRYDFRDYLKLSAGRSHTAVAYWNNAFHHGQWMQTTIARPEMVRGGNALVPLHFVGVVATGSMPHGPVTLSYNLGLGNGRGTTVWRAGDAGDANNSRARVAAAAMRMPALGLEAGVSYYGDRITPTPAIDVHERILSAHLAGEHETPEFIVEYAQVRHDPQRPARAATTSQTGYGQLAYRLSGRASALKPYARYDVSRVPATDTILGPLRLNFDGLTGGVRYDAATNTALKVEYRSEQIERGPRLGTFAASVSFMFSGGSHHAEAPPIADPDARATSHEHVEGKTP